MKITIKVLALIIMLIIGASGTIKLLDASRFQHTLEEWTMIPHRVAPLLAITIPATETVLAACWLVVKPHRRILSLMSAVMILGFTAMYAAQSSQGFSVSCGCFGRYSTPAIDGGTSLYIRNGLMLTILLLHARQGAS